MSAPATPRRVAVIGGGISGLAAAYEIARARKDGAPVEEVLLEASPRLGGVIRTERRAGFLIEAGPDSFLAEKPEAAALARELGLGGELIGSNDHDRRTYVLHRGRLVPLPEGLAMLVPTRLLPVLLTPLLPLRTKLAIVAEWFMRPPQRDGGADESVARFVRRHFGDAMLENIAEPLLAGVYGGEAAALSARSALPRFWEMERQFGSLTRGALTVRKQRQARAKASAGASGMPLFMTLRDGLGGMIDAIRERLEPSRVHLARKVHAIEASPGTAAAFRLRSEGGFALEADSVVLAAPAYECARLLAPFDAALGERLGSVPYHSATTVALAYDVNPGKGEPQFARPLPPGFGFLVPRREGKRLLACTFVHAKFPHRAPEGKLLLRCFLSGAGDTAIQSDRDDHVVRAVRQDLDAILGLRRDPVLASVYRWPRAMAQYTVGHEERLRAASERLEKLPGIYLAGNAWMGIGISDCIRSGKAAAAKALEFTRRPMGQARLYGKSAC